MPFSCLHIILSSWNSLQCLDLLEDLLELLNWLSLLSISVTLLESKSCKEDLKLIYPHEDLLKEFEFKSLASGREYFKILNKMIDCPHKLNICITRLNSKICNTPNKIF